MWPTSPGDSVTGRDGDGYSTTVEQTLKDDAPAALVEIAHAVRALRTVHRMTQDQLGRQIGYSRSQVNDVEHARQLPHVDFATACDATFNTGTLLVGMHERAQRHGLPSWAAERIEYEARAVSMESYQTGLIHGFLQTADYTRAVLGGGLPGEVSDDQLSAAVERRLRRQEVLTGGNLEVCHIILDESTIYHHVGSREVMREQLAHVLDVIDKRLATIQVLPNTAGACAPPAPFTLMTLDDSTKLVYQENALGGQTTSNAAVVRRGGYRMDVLRAQARPLGDSARMIRARMEDL